MWVDNLCDIMVMAVTYENYYTKIKRKDTKMAKIGYLVGIYRKKSRKILLKTHIKNYTRVSKFILAF